MRLRHDHFRTLGEAFLRIDGRIPRAPAWRLDLLAEILVDGRRLETELHLGTQNPLCQSRRCVFRDRCSEDGRHMLRDMPFFPVSRF